MEYCDELQDKVSRYFQDNLRYCPECGLYLHNRFDLEQVEEFYCERCGMHYVREEEDEVITEEKSLDKLILIKDKKKFDKRLKWLNRRFYLEDKLRNVKHKIVKAKDYLVDKFSDVKDYLSKSYHYLKDKWKYIEPVLINVSNQLVNVFLPELAVIKSSIFITSGVMSLLYALNQDFESKRVNKLLAYSCMILSVDLINYVSQLDINWEYTPSNSTRPYHGHI